MQLRYLPSNRIMIVFLFEIGVELRGVTTKRMKGHQDCDSFTSYMAGTVCSSRHGVRNQPKNGNPGNEGS